MKYSITAVGLLLAILGVACGGSPTSAAALPAGFNNQSQLSQSTLDSWWSEAQTSQFVSNVIARYYDPTIPAVIYPADTRAQNQQPGYTEFTIVPHDDGRVGFVCSRYTTAPVSVYWCCGLTVSTSPQSIYVADNCDVHSTSVYEMQNVIYRRLGYDMTER